MLTANIFQLEEPGRPAIPDKYEQIQVKHVACNLVERSLITESVPRGAQAADWLTDCCYTAFVVGH